MRRAIGFVVGVGLAVLPSCDRGGARVVIYTSVDDVFATPVFAKLEGEIGVRVEPVFDAEAVKTTGLYHRLLAERAHPVADVFWSSEPMRTAQLEAAGVLAPYTSPGAKEIPSAFRSASGGWTGFGLRARVIVYNTSRVPEGERPRSIRDLADARFRGEAAISDPLHGTMATHAVALRVRLGSEKMEGLLRVFIENGVKLLPGNSVVRDRVASGELKCGLTDSDDAFVALERGMPIGVVFPDQEPTYPGLAEPLGTFVFPNTVSLIAGGNHPELARKVIDFLLRPETEEALAQGESAQIPVRPGLRGPERLRVPAGLIRMEVSWEEMAKAADACVPFLRGLVER